MSLNESTLRGAKRTYRECNDAPSVEPGDGSAAAAAGGNDTIQCLCVDDASHHPSLLDQAPRTIRTRCFDSSERQRLDRLHAHYPRRTAALCVESCNPESRLSVLPKLGPLQMVKHFVQSPCLVTVGGYPQRTTFFEGSTEVDMPVFLFNAVLGAGPVSWLQFATDFDDVEFSCGRNTGRGSVILAGGSRQTSHVAVDDTYFVDRYDNYTARVVVRKGPSMLTARRSHCLQRVDNVAFVVGGLDRSDKALGDVECLKLDEVDTDSPDSTYRWSSFTSRLTRGLFSMASCVLPGGKLHVAGGYSASGRALSHAHYVFDVNSGIWFKDVPLPEGHFCQNADGAQIEGLFFIPGCTEPEGTMKVSGKMCLAYDPRAGRWQERAPMPDRRFGHRTMVLDGERLIVAGGYSEARLCPSREDVIMYDIRANRWTNAWFKLPTRMADMAAAILD